ncbi:MAG TPA: restriction endonuclease subunit M [Candidatus Moranbacteria bacterium]|nr:restriction endonuclease subunit M [Candidatus Moranbacteria bacterium]
MTIFQKSVIKRHLDNLDKERVEKAYQKFRENYSPAKIEEIKKLKEEEYQDGFLRDIFVDVFGYTLKPDDNFNLAREFKNQGDGKKADGAILKNEKAVAVIELKSTKTKDLKSITYQAFNYKNNQPECKYVITSNFQKLRFYIDYSHEYEEFDLFNLQKDDFELLYLLFNANSIFSDLPLKLKEETKFHEQEVSDKLYKDYSVFKSKLFENLIKNNPDIDKLTLFNKSQKLLDRFLFILFAEDSGLLPPNSISRIIDTFHKLTELDAYKPIYDIYKQYFGYMNIGKKGKTNADNIPAYNGGLFYTDKLLDNLKIDDKILIDDLLKLSEYDFNTEVDVNILGHIFEHSLSEIEEITAEIEGTTTDKSKRKRDGVFYTPKYITQYIVENTIGTLCNEKRKELEIEEIEFDGSYRAKDGKLLTKGKKLFQKLNDYKDWLLSLKIVDPACGSGAFLNQALNFLIAEHKNIDDIIAELTSTALRLFDTDKAILENNLYGVDINEESVEIAKLSLWLRTAQKGRKLSNLNDNIKCGNSLIDDSEIAGKKALDWNLEFKEIMDNGCFDVVIGNPPYGAELGIEDVKYYRKNYHTVIGHSEIYYLFIEKSIKKLVTKNGIVGLITPNAWLSNKYATKVRELLINSTEINVLINFNRQIIFKDANVETSIFIVKNTIPNVQNKSYVGQALDLLYPYNQDMWSNNQNYLMSFAPNKKVNEIIQKVNTSDSKLSSKLDISNGIKPYQAGYGTNLEGLLLTSDDVKSKIYHSDCKVDELYKNEIKGKGVHRYSLQWEPNFIKWGKWLMSPKSEHYFEQPKILIRQIISDYFFAYLDYEKYYADQSLYVCTNYPGKNEDLLFYLALLNSKLYGFYFRKFYSEEDDLFPKIKVNELKNLPIKLTSVDEQKLFSSKAKNMLNLNKQIHEKRNKFLNRINDNFEIGKTSKKLEVFYNYDFKTFVSELKKQKIKLSLVQQDEWEEYFNAYKSEINQLQDEINTTDREIDKMVYELYGLSEEEIGIVEEK